MTTTRRRSRSNDKRVPGYSLGVDLHDAPRAIRGIAAGLPTSAWRTLETTTGLDRQALGRAIQVPPRTLARRMTQGKFRPDESERLMRVARIFEQTQTLFEGDAPAARRWLTTRQSALNGHTPLDYARTDVGAREVEDLIGRLEHGLIT